MPLNHEFVVISKTNVHLINNGCIFEKSENLLSDIITIHDDLIEYFADSLIWLNSYNPSSGEAHQGFCLYGYTLFDQSNIMPFKKIFMAWQELFNNAPSKFTLTGSWSEIIGEENSGHYAKITINRHDLLRDLQKLDELCQMVINNNDLVLLHSGI